ncbi:MAG: hypothetical protein FJ197_06035 [Gammaproteobacteria bacterium]|nr:hypothetical protein [Gammaproteobacteria bacterium]
MTIRWPWLWPLLAVIAVYAIAPTGELVWDDQIVARQQMAAVQDLGDVFVPPPDIPQWTYSYYRPVVVLSYLLDQALFGRGAAAGPHAMNVLWQLLVTLGVWSLARRLLRDAPAAEEGAVAAALLFAVHPLHTESVSWITGRSDVLATMFLLPALTLTLAWRDSGSFLRLCAVPFAAVAALLAKEVAIAGLLLAPLLLWLAPAGARPMQQTAAARAFAWIAAGVAWLAAASLWWLLRAGAATRPPEGADLALPEAAVNAVRATGYYLAKLVWPYPQTNFVTWEMAPAVPVAAGIVMVAIATAILALRFRRASGGAALAAGAVWIGVAMAPALPVALTSVAATPLAERYLYLPSVGLALIAGALVARYAVAQKRVIAVAALILVAFAAATVWRGTIWRSDLRLWADAAARAPGEALPLIEYGKAQFQAGRLVEAELNFDEARRVADTSRLRATADYNRGVLAAMRADFAGAERLFRQAVAEDPGYAMGHYGVGRALLERVLRSPGRAPGELLAEARAHHQRALELNSSHVPARLDLARILAAEAAIADGPAMATASARAGLDQIDRAVALDPAIADRPEVRALAAQLEAVLRAATGGGGA